MAAVQFGRCGHRGRCRIAVFLVRENVAFPLRCGRVVDTLCLQWYAQPEILTATNRLAEAVPGAHGSMSATLSCLVPIGSVRAAPPAPRCFRSHAGLRSVALCGTAFKIKTIQSHFQNVITTSVV